MAHLEDSDRLAADDAHILALESSVITGHTLKLNVLAPGTAPIERSHLELRSAAT